MTDQKDARQVKLLNLGFDEFVKDLETHSKVFFPKRSKDLSPFSSGKMMLEQAAFIGDILSFYLEDRFRNSNMTTANDIEQIYNLSQYLGHFPVGPRPARGNTNFYLEVPATTGSLGEKIPDMRYAVNFKNVQLQSENGIFFEALDDVDFSDVDISSSVNLKVSKVDVDSSPTHFVIRDIGEVIAGQTVTQTTVVGEYKAWKEIEISEPNVTDVISVVDSDGDEWFEVDHLSQEVIFEGVRNTGEDSLHVPYNLKLKTVPKRFVARPNPKTGKTTLIFGPGKATEVGTPFVPDPSDIALDLRGKLTFSPPTIDPQNFLKSRTLGLAPFNTTLTIKTRVGGGIVTNTAENSLNGVTGKDADFASTDLDATKVAETLASFASNNTNFIGGGEEADNQREVKERASGEFAAQGRVNTKEDYIARSLSLPAKFGKVFRIYAARNGSSLGGVQLYVLAKNSLDQVTAPTINLRKNLKNYLSLFTRISQGVDVLDGLVVNIGLEATLVVSPGFNKTQVKLDVLTKLKDFFAVDKWQLNQPIIIDEVRCLIKDTDGVLSIPTLRFKNKNNIMDGKQYSGTVYSLEGNTKNGIIFAPQNGMFEMKFRSGPDLKVGAL